MERKEKSRRVLVVDDQTNWREALEELLKNAGYIVRTAANFEEAQEALQAESFDLAVLDVRLVDADVFNVQGLELLRLIKAREPTARVIVLTGYPESIRQGVLERLRADDLILKVPPNSQFNIDGFRRTVDALLSSKE